MAEKKSENAKAAAKKTAKKPNVFKRLAKYLGSCKSEIKRSHTNSEADNKELWYCHCYGSHCRRIYLCS